MRLRDLVGNGRQGLEHLFRSFDLGARSAIPGGLGSARRARFISKGDFAEAVDLLVHQPNLEVRAALSEAIETAHVHFSGLSLLDFGWFAGCSSVGLLIGSLPCAGAKASSIV